MKKLGAGFKKLGQSKGLTKLAKIGGGAMSIMSGIGAYQDALAAGKSNSQAIGIGVGKAAGGIAGACLLYTSPSPRDVEESRMPSSA